MARLHWQPWLVCAALLWAPGVGASDHADPIWPKGDPPHAGARIAGLFVFPQDGHLVLVLDTRPGILPGAEAAYDLRPYTYKVFLDLHSLVRFECEADLARYGGTVASPQEIAADVEIALRLDDDGSLRGEPVVRGLDPSELRVWTGLRDDPFILPRFERRNVVAMVLSVPFAAFPGDPQDFVVWAVSTRTRLGHEIQVDHVGRANRTMLPRFDFLNELPPAEHAAAVWKRREDPNILQAFSMEVLEPLKALRHYDPVPDVLIYTRRREPGFPNGRLLTDDVAALTCQQGDCLLWELSFAENHQDLPRPVKNDKAFLAEFPYLAEPW